MTQKHDEDEHSGDRGIKILLACLLGAIILFGAVVYINQYTGFITANNLAYYQYSNGEDQFNVRKVIRGEYIGWQTEMYTNDYRYILELYNDPGSLEDVSVDRAARNALLNDVAIVVTWPPEPIHGSMTAVLYSEMQKVFSEEILFNRPMSFAQTAAYKDFPVATCDDATRTTTVILLDIADAETSIKTEGNCVILQGASEAELMRAADRLLYLVLGIMK
ncbi:MAG: hypothetical protein KJ955_00770 [Nanoarchaeota archaeon]|nr:hypothetical protein [Nanoarchaeota archaeon]